LGADLIALRVIGVDYGERALHLVRLLVRLVPAITPAAAREDDDDDDDDDDDEEEEEEEDLVGYTLSPP
jgi:hypothetical protein